MHPVGTIGKPHGVRGDVYLRTDFPQLFMTGASVRIGSSELTVAEARKHGDRFLVRFEGVADRDAAESLRGQTVSMDRDLAADLGVDEYLIEDLIGRQVTIVGRQQPATIVAVVTTSPQHRLVLDVDGRQREVPFHPDIVSDDGGHLSVDPPPGLLD